MVKRSTTIRDKHRAAIRRQGRPCHICDGEIDYGLPYLHPLSFVVDHVIPVNRGGEDALRNKDAAHRLAGATGRRVTSCRARSRLSNR